MTKCDRYKIITSGHGLSVSSCEKLDEHGCHSGCYESFIDEDEFTGYVTCNGDLSKCPRKQKESDNMISENKNEKVHAFTEYVPESNNSWKIRFQDEYRYVKNKYDNFHKMIVRYEAGTLDFTPNCNLELLKRQAKAMGEYLYILELRAEIEGVKLDETVGR